MAGERRTFGAKDCCAKSRRVIILAVLDKRRFSAMAAFYQSVLDVPKRKTRLQTKSEASKSTKSNAQIKLIKPVDENTSVKTTRKRPASKKSNKEWEDKKDESKELNDVCESPIGRVKKNESLSVLTLSRPDVSLYQKTKQVLHTGCSTRLLGRDKEIEVMNSFIQNHISKNSSGSMYVSGAPGTGKTACLSNILNQMKAKKNFKYAYINCMMLKNITEIYKKIAQELGINNFNQNNPLNSIQKETSKGKPVIIVLDEIDHLDSKDHSILYSLFGLPHLKGSNLILIGIANSLDLTDRTVPLLKASGYKPVLLHFPPYTQEQITNIIKDRLQECSETFKPSAIQFCSRKIAACTGDIRKALEICRRAVEIVEYEIKQQQVLTSRCDYGQNPGSPKKSPGKLLPKVVDIPHISKVLSDVFSSQVTVEKDLNVTLPLQQKLLLCTVLVIHKLGRQPEVTMRKLCETYNRVCKRRKVQSVDESQFQSMCSLLDTSGLITIVQHRELMLSKVSLRTNEQEIEHVLQDKTLLSACLSDTSVL